MTIYKLAGVVVYKSLYRGCGHYTAFVKSPLCDTDWIYMDDAEVQNTCQCCVGILESLMHYLGDFSQCCDCTTARAISIIL